MHLLSSLCSAVSPYFRNLLIVSRLSGDVPVVPFSCGLIACGFQLIGSCGCQGLAAVNYSESGLSVKQHVEKHSAVYLHLRVVYLMLINVRCRFERFEIMCILLWLCKWEWYDDYLHVKQFATIFKWIQSRLIWMW